MEPKRFRSAVTISVKSDIVNEGNDLANQWLQRKSGKAKVDQNTNTITGEGDS